MDDLLASARRHVANAREMVATSAELITKARSLRLATEAAGVRLSDRRRGPPGIGRYPRETRREFTGSRKSASGGTRRAEME